VVSVGTALAHGCTRNTAAVINGSRTCRGGRGSSGGLVRTGLVQMAIVRHCCSNQQASSVVGAGPGREWPSQPPKEHVTGRMVAANGSTQPELVGRGRPQESWCCAHGLTSRVGARLGRRGLTGQAVRESCR
jgi:hypothetical protein